MTLARSSEPQDVKDAKAEHVIWFHAFKISTPLYLPEFENGELIHLDTDLEKGSLAQRQAMDIATANSFSNFEIGDLRFFRSNENESYDSFHFERFADAPITTLCAVMLCSNESDPVLPR
jgi:hypothetical protein